MHTKEEITKKKSLTADIQGSDESVVSDNQLRKKRLYIILSIFFTIGLSLIFIIYRHITAFIKNPVINLPQIPKITRVIPLATGSDNKAIISNIIGPSNSNWNIVIAQNSQIYNWSNNKIVLNQSQVNTLTTQVQKSPVKNIENLPEGLVVHVLSSSTEKLQKQTLLIVIPNQQLLIDYQYAGNSDDFNQIISRLTPALYWQNVLSATKNSASD